MVQALSVEVLIRAYGKEVGEVTTVRGTLH